eukprot:EG_transcript_66687
MSLGTGPAPSEYTDVRYIWLALRCADVWFAQLSTSPVCAIAHTNIIFVGNLRRTQLVTCGSHPVFIIPLNDHQWQSSLTVHFNLLLFTACEISTSVAANF